MSKSALLTVALCVMLVVGCGGSKKESLMEGLIENYESVAETLEGIKDVEGAKAAVPEIEAVAKRLKELFEDSKSVGEPTEEEQKQLMEKFGDRMKKAQARLGAAMGTLMKNPEILKEIQAALEKVTTAMN